MKKSLWFSGGFFFVCKKGTYKLDLDVSSRCTLVYPIEPKAFTFHSTNAVDSKVNSAPLMCFLKNLEIQHQQYR